MRRVPNEQRTIVLYQFRDCLIALFCHPERRISDSLKQYDIKKKDTIEQDLY